MSHILVAIILTIEIIISVFSDKKGSYWVYDINLEIITITILVLSLWGSSFLI